MMNKILTFSVVALLIIGFWLTLFILTSDGFNKIEKELDGVSLIGSITK